MSPSLCLESEKYIQMSPYEEVKGIAKSNFKNGIRFLMSFGQHKAPLTVLSFEEAGRRDHGNGHAIKDCLKIQRST